jgi:hypothetical protein
LFVFENVCVGFAPANHIWFGCFGFIPWKCTRLNVSTVEITRQNAAKNKEKPLLSLIFSMTTQFLHK